MVPNEYFNIDVWVITSDGHINTMSGIGNLLVVRPVIELYKNDDILKQ